MRFIAIAGLILLAACVPEKAERTDMLKENTCGADALQHLVGRSVSDHDFTAEAKSVRILPPGSAMTMDHRPDRLNVAVGKDEMIERIWCG